MLDPTPPPPGTPRELYLAFDTLWSGSPAKPLTVSGRVKDAADAAPPAGTELTVTRTEKYSGATKALGTVKTAADGRVSLTDTPPTTGAYHYAFKYAGSAEYNGFTETKIVNVDKSRATLTLDRNNAVAAYGATVNVTATLGKTLTNRVVEIWADPAGSQPNRLIKKGAVSSTGKISASIKLTRNTAVTAKFAGDGGFYDASRTVNLWTKVAASTTLKRHYKTAKIGTVRYQYFRKSTQPLITHTVTPYPGRKVRTTIQYWSGGNWKLWSARNTKLTSTGKASFSFLSAAKAGTRFRVQVSYLPGTTATTAGDRLNYNTNGPWKYFVLTK
ncbi:hypothetical protein Ait01nite_049840 [Actinoplanes italicus]|uniref:Ig-like domain-containing protein n=1 Tax=Actinoplanes italicus TaxID=113567 RepID=A0A2T0KBA8_9ACTN|nr:hypothetical protein [Actinoplanes italicus]PRX20475.1 hypothetical protein CLV67_108273 [Actinoplanes italicus]GIE31939.1 hypothetical protein Ait01nite_049840 [Actinoplanes italicus]